MPVCKIKAFFIGGRQYKMLPTDSVKQNALSAPPCWFILAAMAGLDCISDAHYSTY